MTTREQLEQTIIDYLYFDLYDTYRIVLSSDDKFAYIESISEDTFYIQTVRGFCCEVGSNNVIKVIAYNNKSFKIVDSCALYSVCEKLWDMG